MEAIYSAYLHLVLYLIVYTSQVSSNSPVVTLSHGGQLQGLTAPFGTSMIDAYLGVRYAEPPVGNLRFKKPLEAQGWSGIREANRTGSICFQYEDNTFVGSEDCLYLNIYTPNHSQNSTYGSEAKMAVMVWIHGGAYTGGSGNRYSGAPLSVMGGVIVVTINYRLGALGFLTDEQGNGNFGLWDQRAALQWIQKNIAAFGGDPDEVTIFGESAGAGSVSALMLSQHTDGLFTRCILQSGSLFLPWSWYLSTRDQRVRNSQIRENINCSLSGTGNIFDCFAGLTSEQAFTASVYTPTLGQPSWAPTADNDFFPSNINDEDYSPSQKYDMLAGFNGQEGGIIYSAIPLVYPEVTPNSGVSKEIIDKFLLAQCSGALAPMSPDLCVDFLKSKYRLKYTRNNRERAIKLTFALGEISFNADIHRLIEKASEGNRSTYAYYNTQLSSSPPSFFGFQTPDWLRKSPTHAEELSFVFGAYALQRETNQVWRDIVASDPAVDNSTRSIYTRKEVFLSNVIMTLWTNFAKSGNPNQPKKLPWSVPRWPQYRKDKDIFMQLHSRYMRLIRTPNNRRLEAVRRNLLSATRLQYLAENQQCV